MKANTDLGPLIFEASIPEPNSGCWIWMRGINKQGYGKVKSLGRTLFAHRASFETFVGEIPIGMQVCHSCDLPGCVNPDHLFLGTSADNHADRNKKGRQASGDRQGLRANPERAPRGVRNAAAKLTESEVIEIRRLLQAGSLPADLAEQFGMSVAAIRFIEWRKTWRHL